MLTQRQKDILQQIVRQYTATGQPVGSKTLAAKLPQRVSSATVRNEMAVLEKAGLIEKEHSSSGRLPSEKGYRFYVDHLLNPDAVTDNDLLVIQHSLGMGFGKIDELISHSADILSLLTTFTAFTLKPEQEEVRLSGFRLVPLGNQKVMAILVTDSGDVESQTFNIPRTMSGESLETVVRLINDQLTGLTLPEVVQRLKTDIPAKVAQHLESADGFLDLFDDILKNAKREHFFVGGRMNLLGYSVNQNPQAIKALYGLLDTNDRLSNLLDADSPENGISVKIGNEIADSDSMKNYSLITATYDVDQYGKGIIAVLGPTRMPYSRTIGIVDAFRRELAQRLLDYYHHFYNQ